MRNASGAVELMHNRSTWVVASPHGYAESWLLKYKPEAKPTLGYSSVFSLRLGGISGAAGEGLNRPWGTPADPGVARISHMPGRLLPVRATGRGTA